MKYFVFLFMLIALCSSCMQEQDFNQLDDLSITPTITSSILYMEAAEDQINAVVPGEFYSEEFNFDAFAEDFFADGVLSGVLTYEIENSTSKSLQVIIELLDENGNVLDTEPILVEPAPPVFIKRVEIAYGPGGRSIDIIKNTSAIRVSAQNLSDDTSVSSESEPKIILRSSGSFKVELG
ncbi:hypothetical protein SB49_08875 [Sediminicola sp. YIK13]|uniref:hypothetical protein n=1 Tax=Sediminicola sp. YIK13 TaxID=1453352 RepID=UPI00071FC0AA|nr:hypothetical protein [Sediminicola sp. YIK13]ALM07900.1 hypothetical protein SB49_08875 [Sediminicola sp. YIK13]